MRSAVAIGAFGALGALARWSVQQAVPRPGQVPWGTFTVNVLGAVLAGLLVGLFARRISAPMWVEEAIFIGFLGGFTTFSAFSLETALLLERGAVVTGVAYAIGSVVGGIAGVLGGIRLGRLF